MEKLFCQSCGMPMATVAQQGTNKDASANNDYCVYCYKDGAFTRDCTMDEMIETCAGFVDEYNKDAEQKLTKEQAIANMNAFFPKLKRWAKA